MNLKFQGVCPVVNVPFYPDERIDYVSFEKLIEFTLSSGVKSLCLFAFNSEPHKMTSDQKKSVIRYFLKTVDHRAETLIGLIDNSISGVIELGLVAKENGADGIILYPPALSTPAQAELLNYFKTIADAVGLDVMIQDNPRSTGVNMSLPFLLDAFRSIESFRYLKVECPIPIRKMSAITEQTGKELKCYSGNGGIFAVDAFQNGAWGIMPGVVLAKQFQKLYDFFKNGKMEEARNLFEKILPFAWFEDQSLEFYIACEKHLLKKQGVIAYDTCRAPFCALTEKEKNELETLYERMQ